MLANSFFSFCGLRVLTALGLGALLPIGVTYHERIRTRSLSESLFVVGMGAGIRCRRSGGLHRSISHAVARMASALSRRVAFHVLVIVCHYALPESLQYAAMRGRSGDIAGALSRLNPAGASRYLSPPNRLTGSLQSGFVTGLAWFFSVSLPIHPRDN